MPDPIRSFSGARATFSLATLVIALLPLLGATPTAIASPTVVNLRIEGRTATLFEGPLRTEGHRVRASSDSTWRRCDGTNNGMNPLTGPTPTASADDAMRLIGWNFDAQWYPGFDDYFIQRFGPDREDAGDFAYWGLLINGAFTTTGGCQMRLAAGDESLWAYAAFNGRRFLRLSTVGEPGPAPELGRIARLDVEPGEEFQLRVQSFTGGMDGVTPEVQAEPTVPVAPVITAADGVQSLDFDSPLTEETDSSGLATFSLDEPGWHRFKAGDDSAYVRSNRIDVCVGDCPTLPPDAEVRTPPPLLPLPPDPPGRPEAPADPDPRPGGPGGGGDAEQALKLRGPQLVPAVNRRGQVGVSWRVIDAGPGLRAWRVESRARGVRGAGWVGRARGGPAARSARFRLPAGRTHRLRFTVTDREGNRSTLRLPAVAMPIDDRRARLRGNWRRHPDRGAWFGATRLGRPGATATFRLPAGRPVILLRGVRRAAVVELRVAGRKTRYRIAGRGRSATRQLIGPRRARGGPITLRVLRGRIGLDGASTRP